MTAMTTKPINTELPKSDDVLAYEYSCEIPSAEFPYEVKYVEVKGSKIAYIDKGEGDPILFYHGNPTSMYLWRNVIPYLEPYGRVIAFDHIGMGKSDKLDVEYSVPLVQEYADGFIEKLGLKNITLMLHDWGTHCGFYYAMKHPDNVKGIAFLEALTGPDYPIDNPEEFRKKKCCITGVYERFKSPEGKHLCIDENLFIEYALPSHIHRKLTQEEMNHYRDPFRNIEDRTPLLMWPREIPINNDVPEVRKRMLEINDWLMKTEIPTLHIYAKPGTTMKISDAEYYQEHWKNHEACFIGLGIHFYQEDQPEVIGRNMADWYRRHIGPKRK